MTKTNKITEEQLTTIVKHQKELANILTNIGVLEAQKHSLLHQVADVNKVAEEFKTELQNEYGPININLEDGSYTLSEDSELVTDLE
jgi:predicted  nucleic acid-binding Zn-ribbon protein